MGSPHGASLLLYKDGTMTSVFPRTVMDQLAWRPRVPMTPLGPSGLPHDLERFRPVEREEVQVVASSRIELPVMLRASPMDRGGLHTWLATRKADADKKREEEVAAAASNPWLAKSSQPARAEKKKEELVSVSQSSSSRLASSEEMTSSVQGSLKEKIHPMGRMRAEMQAAAQRTWLTTATATARPDGEVQRNEEESSKAEEIKETKALALRKSLLSAWGGQKPEAEVCQNLDEVSVFSPAAPNSSTVNVDKPDAMPVGCGRPLLAAWTSGQCPIKETTINETRRSLLSSW